MIKVPFDQALSITKLEFHHNEDGSVTIEDPRTLDLWFSLVDNKKSILEKVRSPRKVIEEDQYDGMNLFIDDQTDCPFRKDEMCKILQCICSTEKVPVYPQDCPVNKKDGVTVTTYQILDQEE